MQMRKLVAAALFAASILCDGALPVAAQATAEV